MRFGLTEKIIDQINDVFSGFSQIEQVIIYGSRAKGNQKKGSDIDLTLKGTGLNLELISHISLELDDLLLPYTFDLSIFNHISNPDLVRHIERIGQTFYNKSLTGKG